MILNVRTRLSEKAADLNQGQGLVADPRYGVRREFGALSTLASSPTPQPSWKQEVNRRLAAHKSRKGLSVVEPNATALQTSAADNTAARLAARVAARYAKAPSYSEMQAAEARAALHVAETATRAALEAQAVAREALENLETAVCETAGESAEPSEFTAQEMQRPEAKTSHVNAADGRVEIRWEPDMPALPAAAAGREAETRAWENERRNPPAVSQAIEPVEAAQPIPANVVEFPRELVATRRMRPRLTTQDSAGSEMYAQLSIFEVDPSTISIDPSPVVASSAASAESVSMPEWSAIELDELPLEDPEPLSATGSASALHHAPLGLRLMAIVVDAALVTGTVIGLAALLGSKLQHLPALKTSEICALAALAMLGALYQFLFLSYGKATPGMRWAQISLCTFDDEIPSSLQVRARLVAMLLSLAPVGLGVLWALFDDDHLSWHDRLSQTYLRQG